MNSNTTDTTEGGTIRTLLDDGINWSWYWCGRFDEVAKTVHVFYHERWHKWENRGSRHPQHETGRTWIETLEASDGKRTLIALRVNGVEYAVTNPAYIFDYRDMTHYVSE